MNFAAHFLFFAGVAIVLCVAMDIARIASSLDRIAKALGSGAHFSVDARGSDPRAVSAAVAEAVARSAPAKQRIPNT